MRRRGRSSPIRSPFGAGPDSDTPLARINSRLGYNTWRLTASPAGVGSTCVGGTGAEDAGTARGSTVDASDETAEQQAKSAANRSRPTPRRDLPDRPASPKRTAKPQQPAGLALRHRPKTPPRHRFAAAIAPVPSPNRTGWNADSEPDRVRHPADVAGEVVVRSDTYQEITIQAIPRQAAGLRSTDVCKERTPMPH